MGSVKKAVKKKIIDFFPGAKPGFLIVGAQKAGTTSLHNYLSQHPRLVGSKPKEIRFFDRDFNFKKGRRWYQNHFKPKKKSRIYFEATPEYLYRKFAANRIYELYPTTKIIILLREPVSRAYSAYNMYRDFLANRDELPGIIKIPYIDGQPNNLFEELFNREYFPSFQQVVEEEMLKIQVHSELEEPSCIRRGIYLDQVKRYHKLFNAENVLVIGFKDLISNKIDVLNRILAFLGLEADEWKNLTEEPQNARNYPSPIDPKLKTELISFYESHNEALFKFLGHKVNW